MAASYAFGLFFVDRIDHLAIDGGPGFLDGILQRCDGRATSGRCVVAQIESYPAAAGSLPRKVAWLNVADGSASDMATFFAKGAPGVRIFAPNRTMGLFGSLWVLGGFVEGWVSGAVQAVDTREGMTADERETGAWHSGHGVEPDETIAQLQSDLVNGKDTMLERARAWLNEP